MAKKIRMSIDETLELDYLVEQIRGSALSIDDEPSPGASSIDYISKETGIFNPSEEGTYTVELNGQIFNIEVYDLPVSVVNDGTVDGFYSFDVKEPGNYVVNTNSVELNGVATGSGGGANYAELVTSNFNKSTVESVKIDFSLTQSGDSDANSRDFRFIVYETDPRSPIKSYGDSSVGGGLSRSSRTVDLSSLSGNGKIRFRAWRTGAGPVENYGGSVTIENIIWD